MNDVKEVVVNIDGENVVFVRKDTVQNPKLQPDSVAERIFHSLIGDAIEEASEEDFRTIAGILANLHDLLKFTSVVDEDVDFLVKQTGMNVDVVKDVVNKFRQIKNNMSDLEAEGYFE